jgi:hypothetical protein
MGLETVYAVRDGGVKTAVIDVTNPAFAVTATDAELEAMAGQYIREAEQQSEIPEAVREALRNSLLGRGLMAASGSFLDGMTTYLLKLGPENLGDEFTAIDRRIAASFPVFAARLRLQEMARLMAEGLEPTVGVAQGRPVCLVNIAGGSGADSWNALICLRAAKAGMLEGRKIAIAVLDGDSRGPEFGGRAVAALHAAEAPLSGLDIAFRHFSYEWSDARRLGELLGELGAREAVCGISSEGGLFEYGSDEEIAANLAVLKEGTAGDAVVVGSVTRKGAVVRASRIGQRLAVKPRTIEEFRELGEKSGWRVERVIERPFSYHVRLVKS